MDADLVLLQRRYQESGSVEDEAQWLRARVRSGNLAERRLRIAALLGHPGAVAAAGVQLEMPRDGDLLYLLGQRIAKLGWLVAARAALGVALQLLERARASPEASTQQVNPLGPDFHAALRLSLNRANTLQDLIVSQTEEEFERHSQAWRWGNSYQEPLWNLLSSGLEAGRTCISERSGQSFMDWFTMSLAPSLSGGDLEAAQAKAERFVGGEASALPELHAIQRELAPAILAYYDPIQARRDRCLDQAQIAFPCPQPQLLPRAGRIHRCGECDLNVFDVRGLSRAEAEDLIRTATGRLCLSLFKRADGRVQTTDCPSGLSPYPPAGGADWDGGFGMEPPLHDGNDPFAFETFGEG